MSMFVFWGHCLLALTGHARLWRAPRISEYVAHLNLGENTMDAQTINLLVKLIEQVCSFTYLRLPEHLRVLLLLMLLLLRSLVSLAALLRASFFLVAVWFSASANMCCLRQ